MATDQTPPSGGDDRRPARSYNAPKRDGGPPRAGDRPQRSGERSGERSAERSTGRPAYGDRPQRSSERSGDRPAYGDRPQRSGGDRNDRGPAVRRSAGTPKTYGERGERPEKRERPQIEVPPLPDEIEIGQLDKTVRARLRTLSKENAEDVGRHLVMAGLMLEDDPELAYKHAQVAVARGGRVDVVREAGAITAYATGRFAEALREFRTVRRLNGSSEYLPLMADCERGLGRPERAIALAAEPDAKMLSASERIELAIVVAGARVDMDQAESAYVALSRLETNDPELRARIDTAQVDVLNALGRTAEADALAATIREPLVAEVEEDDVIVYDTAEEMFEEILAEEEPDA